MRKSVVFVLLEGKAYKDSLTLNSMMKKTFCDVNLVIINRGPASLTFDKSFIHTLGLYVRSIEIKELLHPHSLSDVFAIMIEGITGYDRYVFLSDDIALHKNYLTSLDKSYQDNVDLQIHAQKGLIIYRRLIERYAQMGCALFEYGLGLTEKDRSIHNVVKNRFNHDIVMQEVSAQRRRFFAW